MIRYDPTAALPTGTAVLEASAGTGKTYAIAALAARYLADGVVSADGLAVISFSRIASAELRSRVRERLVGTAANLTGHLAGASTGPLDPTDHLLVAGSRDDINGRIARLHRAIAELDAASIMTIHQFCQAMLDELGVLAEQDPNSALTDDLSLIVDQVTDDLFLARYATHPSGPPFTLDEARSLVRSAVTLPDAPLVPEEANGRVAERVAFAAAARDELATRARRLGLYSFDDQLLRLRDSLRGPAREAGLARLRRRCRVVLVDEFQDTDPVQWEILRDAFDGHVPLVLIGDPKQSIYAFRGADVAAYTDAVSTAAQRFSLDVNHRADAGVVTVINALFRHTLLGPGIAVAAVEAAHSTSRLVPPPGSPWAAPARLRCVVADELLRADDARRRIVDDLTAEVIDLLTCGARRVDSDGAHALRPDEIAILVSTNGRGRQIADALTVAGVPVAFSGADSIFDTAAARDWLTLLRALEQPRRAAIRAAILTDFIGIDLSGLAAATDVELNDWAATLQGWSRIVARQGIAALFAAVQDAPGTGMGFGERVLRRPRGERDLTDFRHLAEILHAQHSAGVRGQAMVAWLAEQVERGTVATDRLRRLETDRDAVQIMTVHKAKGLQFPVVLLPEAADLWVPNEDHGEALALHNDGRRVLDLGGVSAPGRPARLAQRDREQAEDRLRALYVAATRAQSQLTMWWARTVSNTEAAPLHRLLFRRHDIPGAPEPAYRLDCPPGDGHPRTLDWLTQAGVAVEDCPHRPPGRLERAQRPPAELAKLEFRREIDHTWRRTSYSGLTEAVHARPPVALVAGSVVEDEPTAEVPRGGASAGRPSPMAALPGGTGFGSLVHHVLESLDWYAPSADDEPALAERLSIATAAAGQRFAVAGVAPQALAEGLLPSLLTPLGPLTGGLPLAGIPVRDRLSELSFEFPLGTSASTTTLADVATLLRTWLPADDPLAAYPDELTQPALTGQVLRGFLTGSIDSVLRVNSPGGPRFVVVDYKTNRLGPEELTLDHYLPSAMAEEMIRTHYPLQAVLYCVALHRFLAARLAGYDPGRHLGGVGYLFVRGMGGREAGDGTGVFGWFPPAGLVSALSDLLADRSRP